VSVVAVSVAGDSVWIVATGDWFTATAAFAGALLAYFGARRGARFNHEATEQREVQSRREEWGRRFTTALGMLGAPQQHTRTHGRTLIYVLLESPLATDDDRRLAESMLISDARASSELESLTGDPALDNVLFLEDDGDEDDGAEDELDEDPDEGSADGRRRSANRARDPRPD
jgi:hypothetical protein